MVLPSQDDGLARARGNRWRTLAFLCLAVVLSLTTWFSATAVAPELQHVWGMSDASAAWLTNGVQIGFMIGAVAASIVNLPDIMRLNQLMSLAALAAAAANAVLLLEPSIAVAVVARGVCGVALAGIYPPALKLIATWFRTGRGLAFGALIGALTLGSSLPHLFRALGSTLDWRVVVAASSIATIVGAVIFAVMAREGPYPFARAVFDPRQIGAVLRNRQLVLANLGYFGHMWELYAMWAWFLAFATAALSGGADVSVPAASVLTFCVVAVGAIGCLIGGVLSDRIGRTATTAGMMIVSFCSSSSRRRSRERRCISATWGDKAPVLMTLPRRPPQMSTIVSRATLTVLR